MPTYEYRCNQCGHEFEQFQSIKDDPVKICPDASCRADVRRLISAGAGFLFKGNGFYETDYRSRSYKEDAKADKPPEKTDGRKVDDPVPPRKEARQRPHKVDGRVDTGQTRPEGS